MSESKKPDIKALGESSPEPVEQPAPVVDPPAAEKPPMFTAEEIEAIRAKAREKVQADIRKAEMARLTAEFEEEERIAAGLAPKQGPLPVKDEELVRVTISLPKFAPAIVLDGKHFVHNYSYMVSPDVFQTLNDQMEMSWRHDREIHGEWFDTGRRQRDTHIRHGVVINGSGMVQ